MATAKTAKTATSSDPIPDPETQPQPEPQDPEVVPDRVRMQWVTLNQTETELTQAYHIDTVGTVLRTAVKGFGVTMILIPNCRIMDETQYFSQPLMWHT